MDYFGFLKKAWNITWRYKALWVLGLFAGMGSSGGSGTSSYQQSAGEATGGSFDTTVQRLQSLVSENLALVFILGALVALIGIALWIVGIAAQGGLVWGANEAAEGRTPALGAAWRVGFAKWGRTFMIGLVSALPILLIVSAMGALVVSAGIAGVVLSGDSGDALAGAGIVVLCLVLPLTIAVVAAASVMLGVVYPLALRYGVLHDVTFGVALKRGWGDLWAKRGAFVFYLVMFLPAVAASAAFIALLVPFAVPLVMFAYAGKVGMAAAVGALAGLVLLVPTAIYGTFVSAAWTVFFRAMTGMDRPAQLPVRPAAPAVWSADTPVTDSAKASATPSAPVMWQASAPPAPPVAPVIAPPAPPAPPADE